MSSSSFHAQVEPTRDTTITFSAAPEQKQHQAQQRVRRRNRLITSCLECRRRKLKCDKGQPCTNCIRNARQCVFIAPGLDSEAQARLADVKEKMGMLERTLEDEIANKPRSREGSSLAGPATTLPGQEDFHSDKEDDEETKDLDPTDFATEDAAYYEDDDNDDIVDLGIAMGKVRITERIGGLVRPKFSEEVSRAPECNRYILTSFTNSCRKDSKSFPKLSLQLALRSSIKIS